MRIAQFINNLNISDGGPARNSFELNISLNQLDGIHADLYSIKGCFEESVVADYGGDAGQIPVPGPRWVKYHSAQELRQIGVRDLMRALRGVDIAIIHGYYLPWLAPLSLLLRQMSIPYVITPHGSLTPHQQKFSRVRKFVFEAFVGFWTRRYSLGFVTGSPVERDNLKARFPSAFVRVGGVGTAIAKLPPKVRGWHTPLELLSMSRIAPKKRVDISIQAVAALKRRGIHAHLTVAGEGPPELADALQDLARRMGVSNQVDFIGQVSGPDKRTAFQQADVFLLPSEDENFGIGLAEALAHGLPAVTTNAVAAAQFMSPLTGLVLMEPTPEEVAEAVEILAGGERQEYAIHAWQCAHDNYSWSAISRQWVTTLKELKGA